MNQRTITNISYVFDGFAPEGTTDYTANGLNQYTETEEAPLLANGQPDPNPAPEMVVIDRYVLGPMVTFLRMLTPLFACLTVRYQPRPLMGQGWPLPVAYAGMASRTGMFCSCNAPSLMMLTQVSL